MTCSAWSSSLAVTSLGWSEWVPAALALLALPGVFYWIVTAVLIARRTRRFPKKIGGENLPPVTFLRPVKRGVPGLEDKARRLLLSARPGDRVLFAVDSLADLAACEAACAETPEGVGSCVVLCEELERARNPKIEKLITLCKDTDWGPQHWIITDSEALPDRFFMDAFRAEWAEAERSGTPLLTAGYRFTGARNLPQKLDHLAVLLTLWPGLAAAERGAARPSSDGLGFTLGACIGVRREDVALAGGWETFALALAEDNRLGAALAEEGRPTQLSREVITLDSDPIGWRDWAFHQHRVAFTYRVCNPAGAFAMIFTHGVTWATLPLLLQPSSLPYWSFFAAVAALRIATARLNAHRIEFLADSPLPRFALATLGVSLAETTFWLLGWLPLPVRWGGRFLKVNARGRLVPRQHPASEAALALQREDRA